MKNVSKKIDLFDESGDQPDKWRREYWKAKLKNPDIVQKISEEANIASLKDNIKKDKQNDFFFEGASVETVLKPRNLENESKDFFKAQLDMTKDFLPKETMAQKGTTVDNDRMRLDLFDQQIHRNGDFSQSKNDDMTMTAPEAFQKVYPSGNPNPQSAAMKPTSSLSACPTGAYSGSDGIPQHRIGSLQLEEKSGAKNINPIGDNYLPKESFDTGYKPPINQLSSGKTSKAWDGMKFSDLDFQAGIGNNSNPKFNNMGDILQKYLDEKKS